MSISKLIKKRREELNLSYRELGEKVCISHTYIRDVEKDKFVPSFDKVVKLAEGLNLEIEDALIQTFSGQIKNLLLEMIHLSYEHKIKIPYSEWVKGGLPLKPLNNKETCIQDFAFEISNKLYEEKNVDKLMRKKETITDILNSDFSLYTLGKTIEVLDFIDINKELYGVETMQYIFKEINRLVKEARGEKNTDQEIN